MAPSAQLEERQFVNQGVLDEESDLDATAVLRRQATNAHPRGIAGAPSPGSTSSPAPVFPSAHWIPRIIPI